MRNTLLPSVMRRVEVIDGCPRALSVVHALCGGGCACGGDAPNAHSATSPLTALTGVLGYCSSVMPATAAALGVATGPRRMDAPSGGLATADTFRRAERAPRALRCICMAVWGCCAKHEHGGKCFLAVGVTICRSHLCRSYLFGSDVVIAVTYEFYAITVFGFIDSVGLGQFGQHSGFTTERSCGGRQ